MSRSYRKNLIYKYSDQEMKRLDNHKVRQKLKRMDDCFGSPSAYRRIYYDDPYCDYETYIGYNSEREWKNIQRPYYESERELHADFMRHWRCK